jgi:hypothetical protein
MRVPILFLLLILGLSGFAQDNYDVELIPSALRNRANATIRTKETVVDMRSPDNVMYTVKQAITVLNKNGDENARLVLFYDKNTSIKSIKGEIYNEVGKSVGKFSQGDFKDESAVQGFSLFEDSRVKHYLPSVNTYPYTIVYNYEIRFKQNLIIPDWIPKPAHDVSVEKSSYTFICKPTDQFRLQIQNLQNKVEENITKDQKILIWKVSNLLAVKAEPFSPNKETYQTSVKIAPEQFSYFNYKGSYTNWLELGKWTYDNLLKGRDKLPEATIQMLKELVKDEKTDKDKARKIYQYLQEKTRYISVQIGIGGFQPVSAAEVDRLGYGDCKGLVNYMQSLLRAVNIESYYCVVEAGSEKISLEPNYASMNQGNHIILCLPLKGDTTWLECTSQKIPFGFLGDFTDDRTVLACTAEGGKLLHTPKLAAQTNIQVRNAELTLDKDGNISGTVKTIFSGAQYDNHEEIIGKPILEQQKILKEVYDIDNINFEQIKYTQKKEIDPVITESLSINIRNYATINNIRLFMLPNAFNVKATVPETKGRTLPVYINRGYRDEDTIVYSLPDNVIPIILPIDKSLNNGFGSYTIKTFIEGNKLICVRKFTLNDGTFPAESYTNFTQFINEVSSSDKLKLVFNLKK